MANSNGSKTIQISEDNAKSLAMLAIKLNKTRREIADIAIEYFLKNLPEGDSDAWDQLL